MSRIAFVFVAIFSAFVVSGCTRAEKGAVIGGAVGAAAGNAIGGNTRSTVIGGILGAGAGAIIGRETDGRCRYRNRRTGRIYIARC